MEPKTKFQKKIVALSETVTPITNEQKRWAEENCFEKYFVRVRNRNNCLECGYKWKPKMSLFADKIIKPGCPNCGAGNLEYMDGWDTDESIYQYYAKIEVVGGLQLVRMFRVEKYLKRKQGAQYYHLEVIRHFIREDGKAESLHLLTHGMGRFVDSWVVGSKLEVRTKSRGYFQRNRIAPYKILPGRETLGVIRRNGYKGYFYGEVPNEFFEAILKHQKAETLLKAGQFSLFRKYVGFQGKNHSEIEKYWNSICIAIRNHYIVKDAGDWLDYLGMLDRLDKDLNNPHYICPNNFKKEHDRYNEKIQVIKREEMLKEKAKKIEEAQTEYVESKGMFFDLRFTQNEIEIVPLKSVEEFLIEGEKLKHCIFNNDYYKKTDSLILSARIEGEPVENIEVDLGRLKVIQSRGFRNRVSDKNNVIVELVRKNMDKIAERIDYKEVA